MATKNKVKKTTFTELYLINKKTLNLIKKKKKEIIKDLQQNHHTSNIPPIYQTHHHYASAQSNPNYRFRDNESHTTSSNSEVENDDEYIDDNLEELLNNENLADENENMENIPQNNVNTINNIPIDLPHLNNIPIDPAPLNNIPIDLPPLNNIALDPPPQVEDNIIIGNFPQEDMDVVIENIQNTPPEIINFNSSNSRRKNIDYLNQSTRATFFNRKRGVKSDIDVIKSVLRDEIKNMREKSREKNNNLTRENPGKNHKPPIVIQPVNDMFARVLPSSSIPSINQPTLNDNPRHIITYNPENSAITLPTNNINHSRVIHRIPSSISPILQQTPATTSSQVIPTSNNNNNHSRVLHHTPVNTSTILQHIPMNTSSQVISANSNVTHIPRENISDTHRKRSRPTNKLVKKVVNSEVENMEVDPESNTSNSNSNNDDTQRNGKSQNNADNMNIPPRTKIHKKSKVIIIENPEPQKPKNSEFVDKILQSNANDPYDVFQFSKTARITYSGLKRKFNAFSKKLHPDKEPSPGAHEAFIIMRRAFIQLKKEIQLRDELEKEKTQTKKKQSSSQTGFGIKKWIKLCK